MLKCTHLICYERVFCDLKINSVKRGRQLYGFRFKERIVREISATNVRAGVTNQMKISHTASHKQIPLALIICFFYS